MRTIATKKLLGLALSVISLTMLAQCPSVTNLGVSYSANGTATITPTLNGTVSAQAYYYWQTSASMSQNSSPLQAQGEFQFQYNGTYLVCLTVIDSLNNCLSSQSCASVTINNTALNGCDATFTTYTDTSCVTYFVGSPNSNGYSVWNIDGMTYTYTPSVNLANGSHNVTQIILDSYGHVCDSSYQNISVSCNGSGTVSLICQAGFTAYTDSACVTYFYNSSIGSNLTYEWYDDTALVSTLQNPSLNLNQGSHFIALYTYSNGQLCDSLTNYINVSCTGTTFTNSCQANAHFTVFADTTNPGEYFAYNLSSGTGNVSYLWDFGDGATSTQQYPFHQYAIPGQYIICLSVNATSDTTTCTDMYCDSSSVQRIAAGFQMSQINVIPKSTTGIKQNKETVGLKVFPNPIVDELTIEATTAIDNKLTYVLIDALGRTVLTGDLNNSKTTINTGNLEKGFYSLNVANEKGNSLKTIKLVK